MKSKDPKVARYKDQITAELTLQLKDETSGFYKYKTPKAAGGYKDRITADDICWGKGRVPIPPPYKVSEPIEKTSLHSSDTGERGM